MCEVFAAEPDTALSLANTYKALLADTLELLGMLTYADAASKNAAQFQCEAIIEVFPEFQRSVA